MNSRLQPGAERAWLALALLALLLTGAHTVYGQQPVPDAPSSSRPGGTLPPETLPTRPAPPPAPEQGPPDAPREGETQDQNAPGGDGNPPPAADIPRAQRRVPGEPAQTREELFTVIKTVDFVMVPVTVKDPDSGRLVDGLQWRDFRVFENGEEQAITYFTSDPFPLSAAVVIDLGLSDGTVRKLHETYPALMGAFAPYDEIAVYTYGNTVSKLGDFTAAEEQWEEAFREVRKRRGTGGGPPVTGGPLGPQSPNVGGIPLDPGARRVYTPPRESRVLNDAVLAAALELAQRPRERRKVLFVISDGRELGSSAGYAEVLKVLLSNEIIFYGVGVDGAAIPIYREAQRIRLPGQGHGNILHQYANATGGQVFAELSTRAIEQAYGRVTLEARNQYTLGYQTRSTPSSSYREIEVWVRRPNVQVFAKDGYYPLPPRR